MMHTTKIVKKILLIFLLFNFFTQSLTKADDIRDFEIEGISIGESLLNFYNTTELNNFYKISYPKSNIYSGYEIPMHLSKNEFKTYESITVHFKNDDKSKIIVAISGIILYPKDLVKCLETRDSIFTEIKNNFTNPIEDEYEMTYGDDKISKGYVLALDVNDGSFRVWCTDWSNEVTKNNGWEDDLNVSLDTYSFIDWVNNKAY